MLRRQRWTSVVAVAAMLAACGGEPSGPTPVASTVEVALASALLVSDTAVAVATVRDQNGNIMSGQTVTWSSSAGGTAAVSATGVVSGVAAGSATITASAGSITGNSAVTVGMDPRFGYAWANEQASATYTPHTSYSHNSSGGPVGITRTSAGVYAVTFSGLGASGAQRTAVQVSTYSTGTNHCKAAGWRTLGADFIVDVKCFTQAGAAADARYTILVAGAMSLPGRLGFAYADNATAASSTPAQARSSRGQGIRVARTGPGVYVVGFDGLERTGTDGPEQLMVTAVGDGSERCTISSWDFGGLEVAVRCFTSAGAPIDSRFSVLVLEKGRTGYKLAHTWANDAAVALYTPDPVYTLNEGGGATEITRTGPGAYSVTFQGLTRTLGATETVLVTAYGGSNLCRIGSWGLEFAVSVFCYDAAGVASDSQFDLIVIQ
jgi:hypothetical protein